MSARFYRIALAAGTLAVVVVSWIAYAVLPHRLGDVGFNTKQSAAGQSISAVTPGGPAAKAGLRAGDVLLIKKMSAQDRLEQPVAGVPVRVFVARHGRIIAVSVIPKLLTVRPFWQFYYLATYVFAVIYALVALLIALRAPPSRATSAILAFILGIALNAACNGFSFVLPTPADVAIALVLGQLFVLSILAGQFAFPLVFPPRVTRACRWIAIAGIPVTLAYGTIYVWDSINQVLGTSFPHALTSWISIVFALLVTIAVADSLRSSTRQMRQQTVWAAAGIMIPIAWYAAVAVCSLTGANTDWQSWSQILDYAAGLAVAYAVLRHRLGGLEVFVSRAATFSIVSLVLVSAFLLAEWGIALILERSIGDRFGAGGQTILAACIALIVGLSARSVHETASKRLNRVFFAQRYRALEALHRFSLETDSAVDGSVLTNLAITMLERHVDAQYVGVYRGSPQVGYDLQRPGEAALPAHLLPDDEIVLRLRRWNEPFVHDEHTEWFSGAYISPMTMRGSLRGFVVCGPKRDHAVYLPDERDTLAVLAHRVGIALEWLGRPETAWAKLPPIGEVNA